MPQRAARQTNELDRQDIAYFEDSGELIREGIPRSPRELSSIHHISHTLDMGVIEP